ncbi:hypothetical protein C3L33_23462, partial [Rhododendron williamsianum]
MDVLKWRLLPLLPLLASLLFYYIKNPLKVKGGNIISILEEDWHRNVGTGKVIDYGDAVVMPGLIDVHAHLDDPGREEWEGFPSGTRAAAAGGLTTLVDMPLNSFPSTVSEKTFELKIQAAEKRIHVDVGINDFPMTNAGHIKEGLSVLAKYKRPLLVHAEIKQEPEGILELEDSAVDPRSYSTYLKTRPASWEEAAIRELLTVTNGTRTGGPAEGAHLHIVHLSDARSS